MRNEFSFTDFHLNTLNGILLLVAGIWMWRRVAVADR